VDDFLIIIEHEGDLSVVRLDLTIFLKYPANSGYSSKLGEIAPRISITQLRAVKF